MLPGWLTVYWNGGSLKANRLSSSSKLAWVYYFHSGWATFQENELKLETYVSFPAYYLSKEVKKIQPGFKEWQKHTDSIS